MLAWNILLALMELITDTCILHLRANKVLESIVMAINFQRISYDVLYAIIMSYNFDLVYYTKLRL